MKKIVTTLFLVLWVILILFLSFQNGKDTAKASYGFTRVFLRFFLKREPDYNMLLVWDGRFRFWAHFAIFFMYGVFSVLVFKGYGIRLSRAFLMGFLPGIFFAVVSETGKLVIEGRHCDFGEMRWNIVGVLLGTLLAAGFLYKVNHINR